MSYQTIRYQMSPRQMAHLDIPIGYAFEDTRSRGFITPKTLEKSKGLGMVIGIVAGVMTAGVGWGVMAAAQGIGGMLAGGAMMAGGVMSAVGSATGNKKLSQIGGYLSLAGGGYAALTTAGGSLVGEGSKSLLQEGTAKAISDVSSAFGSSVQQGASVSEAGSATGNAAPTIGTDTASATSKAIDATGTAQTIGTDTATQGGFGAKATGITVPGLENANTPSSTISLGDKATGITNPSLGSVSGSNVSLNNAAAGAGNAMPNANNGIIADAWKSVTNLSNGSGMMAGQLLNGLAQGGATEELAKAQAAQTSLVAQKYANDQAELQRQIKNMNSAGAIYYDPNDPNAQKIVAAAQAAGVQPLTLTINQNAQVKSPMNAFQGVQA